MKFSSRFPLETIAGILILTAFSYFYLVSHPLSPEKNVRLMQSGTGNGSMSLTLVIFNNFQENEIKNLTAEILSLQVSDARGSFSLFNNSLVASATVFQESEKTFYILMDTTLDSDLQLFKKWEMELLNFQSSLMGKFWSLGMLELMRELEITSNIHIIIICVAYLVMNLTLYALFQRMKKLGSSFSLGFNALINGTFGLVMALVVTRLAGISYSFSQLMDAIPFLVSTVGFEKSVTLSKAVMDSVADAGPSEYIRPKISNAVASVSYSVILDGAFEVSALLLASILGI